MTRVKPSDLIPPDGWIAIRDTPAIIESVYSIPAAVSGPMLRRAVEMFSVSHQGIDYFDGGKVVSAQGNRDLVIPHKVSGWDAGSKAWTFLPVREDMRPPKGIERQAGDDEMRVWNWTLAMVDWQAGTVQGPMGRRLTILLHWRNIVGWIEKMTRRGYLASVTPALEPRPATVDRLKPRAMPAALVTWFEAREAGWPAGRPLPSEADDWRDAKAHFRAGIDREEFRAARRKKTRDEWRAKGPRRQPKRVWPFGRAD